ncbi:MAG: hypothetical protein HZA60_07005 [Deltaproteobacteria bacterium]|nr:hypothetical protein [Deltaproteobacteria bacterium]
MHDALRHRRARAWAAFFLAAAFLSAGCGTRVGTLYEKVLGSPSYSRTTEAYTRTKEVHDGLDTRFILSATWLSPDWIRAFEEEYANIYYLDAARKERVVARWKGESGSYVRFFVALFTPDETGNDLEKPGTLWSLRLVGADEKDYQPVYLRKSSLRPEEISRFFPYSGTWYRAYEVAFPKEAEKGAPPKFGAPRLKLVLSGVQGRAVLAW